MHASIIIPRRPECPACVRRAAAWFNKAMEPTPVSVTIFAAQKVAPLPSAAHLTLDRRKTMKAHYAIPLLLLGACAQPDDPATLQWLSERDGRESVSLYTGIANVLPTTSTSVDDAFRDFSAIEKGMRQLARPIEQKQTPNWSTYIIRSERSGVGGFVILSKEHQGPHMWSGRFIPKDWFDDKKKNEG